MEKLDNPLRRKMLPVEDVLDRINVTKNQYIADIGCGIGYFTLPMAKAVGSEGKVYAIDINLNMLEETKRRVEEQKITNVEMVHSSENNFRIENHSVDIAFTATVFHEVDTPLKFLKESKRILKAGGVLVILDWNKIEEDFGPPIHKRIDMKEVKKYVLEAGFYIKEETYVGRSFYILSCTC